MVIFDLYTLSRIIQIPYENIEWAVLSVTLLGGASFSADGRVVRSELGPAGSLLASYLFHFADKAHRRERLIDLFWLDGNLNGARAAFNTAIWRVRKILEIGSKGAAAQLVTAGSEVILERGASVQVDTHLLEGAFNRMRTQCDKAPLSFTDTPGIVAAVESYGGPFLDGLDGDWILQERERLHCVFVRVCLRLMCCAASNGQYEQAIDFGRRILARDALRESIQRDVMLLLVLNGQRAEALRAYERLAALMRSELNIQPMPETKRLHAAIVSGDIFEQLNELTRKHFAHQSEGNIVQD